MFDKKLLTTIFLSLATVWLFNYFVGKKIQPDQHSGPVVVGKQEIKDDPGKPVRVLDRADLHKPLDTAVVFCDDQKIEQESFVVVENDLYQARFSNYGATLTSLDFKKHKSKAGLPLQTLAYKQGNFEQCFLLAFDQKTELVYSLVKHEKKDGVDTVIFQGKQQGWLIEKEYTLYNASYKVDVTISCRPEEKSSSNSLAIKLLLPSPFLEQLSDDTFDVVSWNEQKNNIDVTAVDQSNGLAWYWNNNGRLFGIQDKYFVHVLVSDDSAVVKRAFVKDYGDHRAAAIFELHDVTKEQSFQLSFYMGPKLFEPISRVDNRLEGLLSFGWLSWLCKLLLRLLSYLYSLLGNFGLAIIVMTILLKLPFAPLSMYSRRKMEEIQRYQPAISKIRAKYRNDVQMQHAELIRFYQDHNISPAGQMLGCLPLLIQMPILFALYRALNNYLALYHAPFFGWITDLSAKDPYYVLPILMGLSMMWQQKMTPVSDEKQRAIMFFMSLVMTVVFAGFPAGLVLYWFMNNILTIAEDYLRKLIAK